MAKHSNNPEIQKWSAIIEFMMSEDWSDMLDQTKDYLRMLDKIRPVQFPEIYKLL